MKNFKFVEKHLTVENKKKRRTKMAKKLSKKAENLIENLVAVNGDFETKEKLKKYILSLEKKIDVLKTDSVKNFVDSIYSKNNSCF